MKKVTAKIVACVAAIAVMTGVLCSCVPLDNRVGEMMRCVTQVRDREREGYERTAEEAVNILSEAVGILYDEANGGR